MDTRTARIPAAPDAPALAELCAVSKSYRTAGGHELKVLENIDLAVHQGELLALWPPLHLAKGYYDMSRVSSKRISFADASITQGPGFHWSDLSRARAGRLSSLCRVN